jgi:hypothetical protein
MAWSRVKGGADKGEWWRGWTQLWNFCKCHNAPQYNSNIIKKRKKSIIQIN